MHPYSPTHASLYSYIAYKHTGICGQDSPTLREILRFRGQERMISIPQEIGVHYMEFGIALLDDFNAVAKSSSDGEEAHERCQTNQHGDSSGGVEGSGKQPVTASSMEWTTGTCLSQV